VSSSNQKPFGSELYCLLHFAQLFSASIKIKETVYLSNLEKQHLIWSQRTRLRLTCLYIIVNFPYIWPVIIVYSHRCQYHCTQGWIQPVILGWAVSAIFGSRVSLRVHYWKRDEVAYTSQHCYDKTLDGKTALYRECCFPNCTKSWWNKFLS